MGDRWQEGFWEAVGRGEIAIQRCAAGHHELPVAPRAGSAGARHGGSRWRAARRIWSWAEFHHRYFEDVDPPIHPVVLVELDEGPRMYVAPDPALDWSPAVGERIRLDVRDYAGRKLPVAGPIHVNEVTA